MHHIWSVFNYELRRNVTRKAFLFTAFALPALVFVLYFGVNALVSNANEDAQVQLEEDLVEYASGYVDLSGVFASVGDLPEWRLTVYPDEQSAQAGMEAGTIDAYYLIAEDFAETRGVRLVLPEFSLAGLSDEPIRQLLLSIVAENTSDTLASRLQFPAFVEEVALQPVTSVDSGVQPESNGEVVDENAEFEQFWIVYGFAMIFLFAIFGTNGYLMQSVIEEKESKIVEILIASVRPLHLLTGKILAMGVLGILQISAWIGTVLVLAKIAGSSENLPSQLQFLQGSTDQISANVLVIFFIYFALGYLFFAAIFGAVGAISTSLSNGPNYATIFTLPAVLLPMLLISNFVSAPNEGLPYLLSFFPLTSPLSMIMRLVVTDVPIVEIIISIVLLILTDIGMIWLAGRLFRSQSLLAGQVPKLKDFPALIRG